MDTMSTTSPRRSGSRSRPSIRYLAAGLAGVMAMLYGLLFAGVLEVGRATDGELGILGVAAGMFVLLAGLLVWSGSRLLWAAAAGMQVLLGWMYLAIAPDRDPAFEVWGVTIRVLSLALLAVLIRMLLIDRRERRASRT